MKENNDNKLKKGTKAGSKEKTEAKAEVKSEVKNKNSAKDGGKSTAVNKNAPKETEAKTKSNNSMDNADKSLKSEAKAKEMPVKNDEVKQKSHEKKELIVEKRSKMAHESPFSMRLLGSFIKDLSFENPVGPYNLTAAPAIDTSCNLNVSRIEERIFEVLIMIKCVTVDSSFTKDIGWGNGMVSNLELSYAGVFEVNSDNPQTLHRLLFVDCPALLFPMVRSCIVSITGYSGLAPIAIDNISYLTWDNEYSPNEQKIK